MKTIFKRVAIAAIAAGALISMNAQAGAEGKCKACHDFGSANKMGPGLAGIMGKKAGSTDFGKYSESLKKGGWTWDDASMRLWLGDTPAAIKELSGDPNAKTTMPKQRLKGAKLDQVMEFLNGLK